MIFDVGTCVPTSKIMIKSKEPLMVLVWGIYNTPGWVYTYLPLEIMGVVLRNFIPARQHP